MYETSIFIAVDSQDELDFRTASEDREACEKALVAYVGADYLDEGYEIAEYKRVGV